MKAEAKMMPVVLIVMMELSLVSTAESAGWQDDRLRALAGESAVVAAVRYEDPTIWYIFDSVRVKASEREEEANTKQLPDGRVYIPVRGLEGLVGRGYPVKLEAVIKGREVLGDRDNLLIFIPGGGVYTPGDPLLLRGNRYILFLSRVVPDDSLKNAKIDVTLSTRSAKNLGYDSLFKVVGRSQGAIQIDRSQGDLIDRINAVVNKP